VAEPQSEINKISPADVKNFEPQREINKISPADVENFELMVKVQRFFQLGLNTCDAAWWIHPDSPD